MLHEAAGAGTVAAEQERNFEARAREIVAGGALGFGEMSCEHLSFNPRHPYTSAPPDHPLILRLAEIAAQLGVPIDRHMEAVQTDMPTPPLFLERSPNNPPTLKANILVRQLPPAVQTKIATENPRRLYRAHNA